MQTNALHVWVNRATTFALAALAALSGAYWILKSTDSNSVSSVPATSFAALDPQALARALGGGNTGAQLGASPVVERAYALVGVLADSRSGGAALIAVDGKPAKPYRVGATVDGNLVLQSVVGRRAVLGAGIDGPAQLTLELPPLSK
ncbi:MAG: type II secretion system protein N [Pseudomonadota bacterium]